MPEKPKSRNQLRAEAGAAEGRRRLAERKAAKTPPPAKSLAPKSPGEQTETGKQITGAFDGLGQGLAALFSEKPAAPQQERPVLPMKSHDYVEKGTYGQYQPGEIMNRARSNRELFKAGKKYTPKQSDYVASQMVYAKHPRPKPTQELMDYVSEGTEGQFNHEAADKIMPQAERQKWAAAGLPNPPQRSGTNPVGYVEEGTHGQFNHWAMHSDTHPAAAYANRKPQGGDSDPEDHDGRPNDPKVATELHERDQAVRRLDQKDPWRERGPWEILRNEDQTFDYVEKGTEGQWGENDQKWGLIRMGMDARDQERSKQERAKGSRGHFDAGHT